MKQLFICSLLAIAAIWVGVKPNPANATDIEENITSNVEALNQAAVSPRLSGVCTTWTFPCQIKCPGCGVIFFN